MFDPTVVTDVSYTVYGASLKLTWTASTGVGTMFQVYVDRDLAWHGVGLTATIPVPSSQSRITIGAVDFGEGTTNFSPILPPAPKNRAVITWTGGIAEGLDLAGFRVYGEKTAGGGVDYTNPLADIQAFADGFAPTDASTSSFSWTSDPYKTGEWTFAVVPYDQVGNSGDISTSTVLLTSPPAEVPLVNGSRLTRTYSQPAKTLAIGWAASEG